MSKNKVVANNSKFTEKNETDNVYTIQLEEKSFLACGLCTFLEQGILPLDLGILPLI